jgi:hypothetical protein
VARRRDPVADDSVELFGRVADVCCCNDLEESLFAAGRNRLHVTFDDALERLRVFPLGMFGRQRSHAVEREEQLKVHHLLRPERAVVVEDGDALGDGHEVRSARPCHSSHEVCDCLLRPALIP